MNTLEQVQILFKKKDYICSIISAFKSHVRIYSSTTN